MRFLVLILMISLIVPAACDRADKIRSNSSVCPDFVPNTSIPVSGVYFPDPSLEAAIREHIDKPSGEIYPLDLEQLTYLNTEVPGTPCASRKIFMLDGLEYCTNLTILNLPCNCIVDVTPLSKLGNLEQLGLDANQIKDISPLSGLTKLTNLYLGSNRINDISGLSNLTALYELDLSENQITDISTLSGLENLGHVDLYKNNVRDISPLIQTNIFLVQLAGNPLNLKSIVQVYELKNRGVQVGWPKYIED